MDIFQKDNTLSDLPYDINDGISDIERIAGRTIKELYDRNEALLVFPNVLGGHHDGIESQQIFTITKPEEGKIAVKTGNLMGFVGCGGSKITIYSRFAESQNGEKDYFLHYMLQRVFSINLFDLQHGIAADDVFDFMLYLFPYHLKRAVSQGLYREYCTREYNDANVRGPIDVSRHIRRNIPFNGRIAYRTREYAYDNHVTQLIRHTIEYIRQHPFASAILSADGAMRDAVAAIVAATPSYVAGNRQKVIGQNLRPARHPYFTEYLPLQRLCMNILQHRRLRYSSSGGKDIYGVLFDGAWLWEEYLYKAVLEGCGFKHPQNKSGKGGIYLFEKGDGDEYVGSRHRRYPDYFKDGVILDAKYKHLEDNKINRDDMHQLIAYMHVEQAEIGGFIYPNKNGVLTKKHLGELRGYKGKIYNIGVQIPQKAESYKDFCEQMGKIEEDLKKVKFISQE